MTKKFRAVLDTNVFISAALSKNSSSPTREVIERWKKDEFVLLICNPLAEEIIEKLLERNISSSKINDLVEQLDLLAEWVEIPEEKIKKLLSDPDDNVVIACAIEGKANYLITYDPHFDILGEEHQGVQIVKAIPFLEILRKNEKK